MSRPSANDVTMDDRGADRDDRASAVAFAALAFALLVRYVLTPWLGVSQPFVTVFGAVAIAAAVGGFRVAIVVAILGYLGSAYLLGPWPSGPLGFVELGDGAGLAAYLFTCGLIIAFGESARAARSRVAEARALLRLALHHVGDAVITTNPYGRIIAMNPSAQALTGWTGQAAQDQPLEKVFRIVDGPSGAGADTRPARNVAVLVRRDGSQCEIEQSATPLQEPNGDVSGCLLVFREAGNQRRGETARAADLASGRLLKEIVDSSTDAIVTESLDGTIRGWNPAAESLFGHTAAEAVGSHVSMLIPRDRRSEREAIVARISAGRRIEHFVTERQRAGGERVMVSLTVSPVRNELGHVIGAATVARDVSQVFASEQRERELRIEAARLTATVAAIERRKGEFVAMLGHELRTPLAAIANAVHALRLDGDDAGIVQSASQVIERQATQLTRLVDDLLDVSRISQGRIQVRRRRMEIAPVIEQALDTVRPFCAGLDLVLSVTVPPEPIYLDADPARMVQVVGNLVHNACRFTGHGGHVSVAVAREDTQVVIRVTDDGIGIPGEFLPRLFETFAPGDAAPGRSREGLGLGLPLVRALVELHGGTITAKSDGTGRGAEFTVRIPAVSTPVLAVGAVGRGANLP